MSISTLGLVESDSEDELPPGWEERATTGGEVYYLNHTEETTQWNHPRTNRRKKINGPLPPNWRMKLAKDSFNVIYENTESGQETYSDPRLAFAVERGASSRDCFPRQRYDGSTRGLYVLHGMDLSAYTVAITGGSSGVGYETARAVAIHGAHVVFLCRDVEKCKKAASKILREKPDALFDYLHCDLSSFSSVRKCAEDYIQKGWSLNVLILNAATCGLPFTLTEDGHEMTFGVNHLGHFLLTKQLCQKLIESAPAKVIVVSCESHRFSARPGINDKDVLKMDCLNPQSAVDYSWIYAYNVSKMCNIMFALALNRRLASRKVFCFAVHPGNLLHTPLWNQSFVYRFFSLIFRPFAKSLEQACSTVLYAAFAPEMQNVGGLYLNNCYRCNPSAICTDLQMQRLMWNISDFLVERRPT